jgi:hypothetical protein
MTIGFGLHLGPLEFVVSLVGPRDAQLPDILGCNLIRRRVMRVIRVTAAYGPIDRATLGEHDCDREPEDCPARNG